MRSGGALALVLGLSLAGCAPGYVTSNDASINLIIAAINGGAHLDSDVRNGAGSTFVCPDDVKVDVAVRNKNPNAPTPSVPSAVLLKSYEVRYIRSDGRGTEGVDVPYRITGNLAFSVDVASSGTSTVSLEVVRRQAKVEPPLSSIFQAATLTVMAEVTLYGETVSGQGVSATGRVQIDFADFLDTATSCPSSN
jgi:hypothetical protein